MGAATHNGPSGARLEDDRFLRGCGRFVDDIAPVGVLVGVLVRSTRAHARILVLDVADARAAEGVRLVLTHADLQASGLGNLPVDLSPIHAPSATAHAQPALANGTVRYVGEPVAFVVAQTRALAIAAAESVVVDYEDLPAVVDISAALACGASHVVLDHDEGDAAATDAIFAQAVHRVRIEVPVNRVDAAPIETRGCVASYANDRFTLHVGTQRVHLVQRALADHVFRVPREAMRVVAPDTGGGFGQKNGLYPEYVLALEAARRLGRPVKWIAERAEALASDNHGRDNHFTVEAAVDGDGRIRAVRAERVVNLGAYASPRSLVTIRNGLSHLTGPYAVDAAFVRVRGVSTNTAPTCPYRGAGRPENVFACERAVDEIARELAIDPVALRRRNLFPAEATRPVAPLGTPLHDVAIEPLLDAALAAIDHSDIARRRAQSRAAGRLRGLGISLFVEDLHGSAEPAPARIVARDGRLVVVVGTGSAGHSHETTFLRIAADRLQLPLEALGFAQSDTALLADGIGTAASWSLTLGGSSVSLAAQAASARARGVAARLMEVSHDDVVLDAGLFRAVSTNTVLRWSEILAADPEFSVEGIFVGRGETVNAGCHVCELEVDPETGAVVIVAFAAAHDFGRVLDPVVVSGQLHGGIVQGIGQAWMEGILYDGNGQLLSGSLLDYALARAGDLPPIAIHLRETPVDTNPLGVKGMGEAGATGAAAAFVNATMDALAPLGVRTIATPLTPARIWRAIAAARETGDAVG